MLADYSKWLAGVDTLLFAACLTFLGGKVMFEPTSTIFYVAMMCLLISLIPTAMLLMVLAGFMASLHDPTNPKRMEFSKQLVTLLNFQLWPFALGVAGLAWVFARFL